MSSASWIKRLQVMVALAACLAASNLLAAPPKVIKATPDNGDEGVDPATREIRVVFNQAMNMNAFSWVGGGESYPQTAGDPRWINDRTCVLPVRLEPNHEYWLSVNNQTFTKFRSRSGEAAEPYPIAFKTGDAGKAAQAPKSLTPAVNQKAIQELREAIDQSYSYRDLHKLDWDALFKEAAPKLEAAKNAKQFALELAKVLGRNQDMHVWFKVGPATIPSFQRNVARNYARASIEKAVPGLVQENPLVATGSFPDGIGYILISGWDSRNADQLKPAFAALERSGLKGLIIDVRPNGGGAEPLAQEFAGCFIDKPRVYGKDVIRQGGKFSDVYERVVKPNGDHRAFRGKVAVLTGRAVMSSCESFLLMMKQVPNCKLVGESSYGSSGNPKPVELSNGVTVFLPSWKDLRPDGTCFEGEGIAPDIEVKSQAKDFEAGDPVLAAALKWLRQGPVSSAPAKR